MTVWLIRLAFFLLLLYAFTWLLRKLFRRPRTRPRADRRRAAVSELVQDPVCKVYVARQQAVRLERAGSTQYFCSRECRRQYVERGG
jgi:YHS domain-containing protein